MSPSALPLKFCAPHLSHLRNREKKDAYLAYLEGLWELTTCEEPGTYFSGAHSVATSEVPVTHPGNLVCVCVRLRVFACACEHMHMFTKVAKLPLLTKAEVRAQPHLWFGMDAKEETARLFWRPRGCVHIYMCVCYMCLW